MIALQPFILALAAVYPLHELECRETSRDEATGRCQKARFSLATAKVKLPQKVTNLIKNGRDWKSQTST